MNFAGSNEFYLMDYKKININDFNYFLEDSKIAKYPISNREESKLLVFNKGKISTDKFINVDNYLNEKGLLILNNTKVIQARMIFNKETGAKIEIFCLEPHFPTDYQQIFETTQTCEWKCIIGNSKKWKSGKLINYIIINNLKIKLTAEKVDGNIIKFEWDNNISFAEILDLYGTTPIPPYLNRTAEDSDTLNYQTVYSEINGSVAAPTAGLHFTDKVFDKIKLKRISIDYITLHVGAGTFKPVQTDRIENHEMHTEHFFVNLETLKAILKNNCNVAATGTTTVRTIESLYIIGNKLLNNSENPFYVKQWEAYENEYTIKPKKAIEAIIDYAQKNNLSEIIAKTDIMIVPSYKFRYVKKLITNFHQPKSTLLLLISAFIGEEWRNIYNYALKNNFRFLSYGDSSVLMP